MTSGIEYLLAGNFIQAFLQVWSDAGISGSFLGLIVLSLSVTLIYIKTREIGLVGLVLTIVSPFLIPVVTPSAQIYFAGLLIFGLASLIYWFFKGR